MKASRGCVRSFSWDATHGLVLETPLGGIQYVHGEFFPCKVGEAYGCRCSRKKGRVCTTYDLVQEST